MGDDGGRVERECVCVRESERRQQVRELSYLITSQASQANMQSKCGKHILYIINHLLMLCAIHEEQIAARPQNSIDLLYQTFHVAVARQHTVRDNTRHRIIRERREIFSRLLCVDRRVREAIRPRGLSNQRCEFMPLFRGSIALSFDKPLRVSSYFRPKFKYIAFGLT